MRHFYFLLLFLAKSEIPFVEYVKKTLFVVLIFYPQYFVLSQEKIVPVVIHIVTDSYSKKQYPNSVFENLVTLMNKGFNKTDNSDIDQSFKHLVANVNINFVLADNDICGERKLDNAIIWYQTKEKYFSIKNNTYNKKLKKGRYYDSSKYLNIWICKTKKPKKFNWKELKFENSTFRWGSSTFPNEANKHNDGVVYDIRMLDCNDDIIKYSICHELGHWFGLYHTWGLGVLGICNKYDDDGISDTPLQKKPHKYEKKYTDDLIQRACDSPNVKTNYQNFMDYSLKEGMFTIEQSMVMKEQIKKFRSQLLFTPNHTVKSLLDKKPHRYSRGNHMSMHYQFEASPPIEIEGFFRSTLNYLYNAESLKRLGFYFIGRGKFEDKSTSEIITQKDIYERLNIERAKAIIRNSKSYHAKTNTTSKEKIRYFYDRRTNEKYPFIQIGNQKWMTKNLNYKTDNSRCYKNDENKCAVYGRLYTWEDAKKVCPKGWRLPTKADWDRLLGVIGNNQVQIRSKFGWKNDKNGTNNSGLNFYPSGQGTSFGKFVQFSGLGSKTNIWLADSNIKGYSRTINGGKYIAKSGSNAKNDFLSCRCIQSSYNESQKPEEVPLFSKPIPSNQNKEIKEGNTLKRVMKTNRNLFYPNSSSQNDYKKTKKKDGKSSPFYKPSNKKLFYPNTSKGKYKRAKKSKFYPNSSSKKFK